MVAICDTSPEVRARIKDSRGVQVYDDYRLLLKNSEVDLVTIATPDHEHYAPTAAALAAGKHVFIEKPIATTGTDIYEFEQLSQRYAGQMHYGELLTCTAPIQALRRVRTQLSKFLWGQVNYWMGGCESIMAPGSWRTTHAYNPMAGGLSHNLVTLIPILGSNFARVRANGWVAAYESLRDREGYDTMQGDLETQAGERLQFGVSIATPGRNSPFGPRPMMFNLQFERGSLAYSPDPASDTLILNEERVLFEPEPIGWTEWDDYYYGRYTILFREVATTISGGKAPTHTIEQALNVARICQQGYDSARCYNGTWIFV